MRNETVSAIRSIILVVILMGLAGTGLELVFVDHFESTAQWVPVVLICLTFLVLGAYGLLRTAALLRVFQAAMIIFIVSGLAGIALHYRHDVERAGKDHPGIQGAELIRTAAAGEAPLLAPGAMIELGILGLAYVFRHPALKEPDSDRDQYMTVGG
jgi:hypothetical protein